MDINNSRIISDDHKEQNATSISSSASKLQEDRIFHEQSEPIEQVLKGQESLCFRMEIDNDTIDFDEKQSSASVSLYDINPKDQFVSISPSALNRQDRFVIPSAFFDKFWTENSPRFKPGWTDAFNKLFEKMNKKCVLSFDFHKLTYPSRKMKFLPFTASAKCKFEGCFTFKFTIRQPRPKVGCL